jgi:urea carboxylase
VEAEPLSAAPALEVAEVPEGCLAVGSPVTGSVWQISVAPGARVAAGDTLVIVEAMKMEVPIHAEQPAEVVEVRCSRGRTVSAGETVLVLRPLG